MTGISDMGPQNYSGWKGPWEVQFVVFATGLLTLFEVKDVLLCKQGSQFQFLFNFFLSQHQNLKL